MIVKVGLFLNTQFQPGQSVSAQLPDLVTQTRAAREAGFKSLWFPHHYLTGPLQMLQIVPMMAYLAQHAEGMQIGPNILILPLLNPVHVAEESATLDVLTGGNYVLGVGLGYREGEFTAFNMSSYTTAPLPPTGAFHLDQSIQPDGSPSPYAPENFTHCTSSLRSLPVAISRTFHSCQSEPATASP